MGTLRILDKKLGDKQILLSKENMAEAQREFDEARKNGFIAFQINSTGAKELIRELNIDAEEIVMTMPMVAG